MSQGEAPADIYAVGFQEIVDLNATNFVAGNNSAKRSTMWEEKIEATLNSEARRRATLKAAGAQNCSNEVCVFVCLPSTSSPSPSFGSVCPQLALFWLYEL